jgi:hypothetical protein
MSGLFGGQALAFTPPPNTIGLTIEGCKNGGNTAITPSGTLPNTDGRFVCQDPAPLGGNDNPYTTGNLGKDWSELDLVPHRLTVTNSGAATVYNVQIAADYENGPLGYDVITDPEIIPSGDLNGFSAAGCAVTSTLYATVANVTGGAGKSIYRTLTITHPADSTCVVDFALRLAVGASGFPGASLQSYKFESEDFQTGKATISLPVNEIEPQTLSKDMTATQDTEFAWNITKEATPAKVNLGNTCDVKNANSAPVTIRVEWAILPGTPGMVKVVTNIYAKNPASRDITVNVSDTIFGNVGEGKVALGTDSSGAVVIPANTEKLVCFDGTTTCLYSHAIDAPDNVSDLSDTATASYTDTATGIPVPGQTEAMASATIQPGTQTNTSATVTDTESISGNGLQYSADSTTVGSASGSFTVDSNAYTLGTHLDKDSSDLLWTSITQNGNTACADPKGCAVGFVEFNKTVYVDPVPAITTGTLSDTAALTASDGFTASAGPANINISTNALVELTLVKTIPDILQGSETIACNFEVKDSANNVVATPQFVFTAGEVQEQTTITGLAPDSYTVVEGSCGGLVPSGGNSQTVDLTLPKFATVADCEDTVTFTNIVGEGSAVAEVNKVTLPAGFEDGWVMTLKGPGTGTDGITLTTADSSPANFERFADANLGTDFLLQEGTYTITETLQTGWENTASSGCEFTINYPDDFGAVKQCTFTNKKLGKIVINKLTDPVGGTGFGFTDDIEAPNSFTLDHGGTKTFLDVPTGTYTVTEDNPTPAYDLVTLDCTDDADQMFYNVIDSSEDLVNRKATINLAPGETVECTYTNRQRGMVDLLKLTNGVEDPNMTWSFTLDGPGVNVGDSTPPTLVDFNMAKLIPGEEYTLCETGIPPSWTLEWQVDTDGDGTPDTIIPMVAGVNNDPVDPETGFSRVYDPNYVAPPAQFTNDTRCVNFVVDAGETLSFQIDNRRPGGEPRTIGFWKNWNNCTGGNQPQTAAANGGPDDGWFILDDLLNDPGFTIGVLQLGGEDCAAAVAILNKSDIESGKKKASDAAYGLAAQLLAAQLNLSAGAETCQAVVDAVNAGQILLANIRFDGTGDYLKGGKNAGAQRAQANALASTLDEYNNGNLCQ